jgi:hypothetical protein
MLTPTAIKNVLLDHINGTGEVNVESVCQAIFDALEAVAACGGISSGRGFGNDPAAQTLSTSVATPTKITGAWTANVESRGVTSDFVNGRLTIQAGGEGHYDVNWNLAFKGTASRGYLFAVRVSRAAVNSGAPVLEMDTVDEEFISAATQIGHCDGFGRIINLQAGDWIELCGIANAASSTFIMRQGQLIVARIDSP